MNTMMAMTAVLQPASPRVENGPRDRISPSRRGTFGLRAVATYRPALRTAEQASPQGRGGYAESASVDLLNTAESELGKTHRNECNRGIAR